jgi:hypothetical protein
MMFTDKEIERYRRHFVLKEVGGAEEAANALAHARELPAQFAASHFKRLNAASPAPELLAIQLLR